MLSAVTGLVGDGEVSPPAQARGIAAFSKSGVYYHCQVPTLLAEWFDKTQLLELYASAAVRTAYDCAPKRYRAQFLCLLNRAAIAEAKRFNECVRGSWPMIMQTFPELGLWRELRDIIQRRIWDTTGEPEPPAPKEETKKKSRSRSKRRRSRSRGRRSRSRSGRRGGEDRREDRYSQHEKQRDLAWDNRWSTSDEPGYDPKAQKKGGDKKQRGRDRRKAIETHPTQGWRACRWARKWRGAIAAMLPSGLDGAATLTDGEVRKLGVTLWKELLKWLSPDCERALGLFRADTQTSKTFGWDSKNESASRGLEPGLPPAEWAFIPVLDLISVVAEGVVGVTSEGLFAAANPLGHKRIGLKECYKKRKAPDTAVKDGNPVKQHIKEQMVPPWRH